MEEVQKERCPVCAGTGKLFRPGFPGGFLSRCPACLGKGSMSGEELDAYPGSDREQEYTRMKTADGRFLGFAFLAFVGLPMLGLCALAVIAICKVLS